MILHLLRHTHSDICTQCSEYSYLWRAYGKLQHQPCLFRLLFPRQLLLLNEHTTIKMVLSIMVLRSCMFSCRWLYISSHPLLAAARWNHFLKKTGMVSAKASSKAIAISGGVYSTERNGTERNDGLNCGTERLLKLKLAGYHCCYTTYTSSSL